MSQTPRGTVSEDDESRRADEQVQSIERRPETDLVDDEEPSGREILENDEMHRPGLRESSKEWNFRHNEVYEHDIGWDPDSGSYDLFGKLKVVESENDGMLEARYKIDDDPTMDGYAPLGIAAGRELISSWLEQETTYTEPVVMEDNEVAFRYSSDDREAYRAAEEVSRIVNRLDETISPVQACED